MSFRILMLTTFLTIFKISGPEEGFTLEWVEDHPIEKLIEIIHVEKPLQYKNLTIFPLSLKKYGDKIHYLTLDEAVRRGDLMITELGDGIVNEVLAQNNSKHYVFLMTGELITGSKQDRMVSYDCLLPPQSRKVRLQVYCIEQGRWTQESKYFDSIGESAHIRMRELARVTKSQDRVWREVERKRYSLKVEPSPTQAFSKILEDKDVQTNIQPYYDELSRVPDIARNIYGVVAVAGDRILVCDLFSSPRVFEKLWPKLLRSYVLDVIDRPFHGGSPSRRKVRDFIRETLEAETTRGETNGVGKAVEITSPSIFGSALIFKEKVVHLDLFPRRVIPLHDSSLDLNFRRQRSDK
ncbi:hypothetical protein IIA15_05400 [candidate division TA06 bacterium]|nr:hypothetical protein [candidate division TA06 bacterium]